MTTRYRSTWHLKEVDLTKKQIKMVHKTADDLPKKDFKTVMEKKKVTLLDMQQQLIWLRKN